MACSQKLPEKLQSFLVDHLLRQSVDLRKRGKGRRKKPQSEIWLIGSAVSFAKMHGLYATRNDASVDKLSACDAVVDAISALRDENQTKLARSNYDAVQKI